MITTGKCFLSFFDNTWVLVSVQKSTEPELNSGKYNYRYVWSIMTGSEINFFLREPTGD